MILRNLKSSIKTLKKSKKGFTLIELIIVMGLFAFASALLMQNLFSIYHFKEVIRFKKDLNFEASTVLNNTISSMVRSGFAINYSKTISDNSKNVSDGVQKEVDKLSIYTDRAETQYFTIYREPHHKNDAGVEIARLMLEYSNGDIFPLHSSQTVIEDFNIQIPSDPRDSGEIDIQPYVTMYLRAHRQHTLTRDDEDKLMAHKNVKASYKTMYTLRNVVPSSYKQPLIPKS